MAAGYVPVFNPSDTPAAADDDGRVIGGGELGVALAGSEQVAAALDAGRLVKLAELGDDPTPEARAVFDLADERTKRAKQFAGMSDGDLHALGAELDLDTSARAGGKADLVHALTMHPTAQAAARPAKQTEE